MLCQGTVAFKIIGNDLINIGKLKNLGSLTKKAVGKIKNKYFRTKELEKQRCNVAMRSGRAGEHCLYH